MGAVAGPLHCVVFLSFCHFLSELLQTWHHHSHTHPQSAEDYIKQKQISQNESQICCKDLNRLYSVDDRSQTPEFYVELKRTLFTTLDVSEDLYSLLLKSV